MSIVIDPRQDGRLGYRESHERKQEWVGKAGNVYEGEATMRVLWPWERGLQDDDELSPYEGERRRDLIHATHHAAADAATSKE